MAYIVQRKDRFYVVAYDGNVDDGIQPVTRALTPKRSPVDSSQSRQPSTWSSLTAADARPLPHRAVDTPTQERLQPTTAHRYEWMIDNYIVPVLGWIPL